MKIGMTGLGRMGKNMKERIEAAGPEVVGFDIDPNVRDTDTLAQMVEELPSPKVVWMMLPLEPIKETLNELETLLSPGDIIIDGGNSYWKDSIARAERFAVKGVHYLDVGTSGGIWGKTEGYALMVGGNPVATSHVRPIFEALKPAQDGLTITSKAGGGHFLKAVHNSLEYTIMAGLGEAYAMLEDSELVDDATEAFASWREGSVVKSWLLDLAVRALESDSHLENLAPVVQDSGEGRWVLQEAVERGVPQPVAAATLFDRFSSRGGSDSARKLEAALRNQFGGHAVTAATQTPESDVAGDSPVSDPAPQG